MSSDEDVLKIKEGKHGRRRRKTFRIDKTILWSREMTLQLIYEVEEYPVLWNMRSHEYRELSKRNAAWQRIAETFQNEIPFEQLKKKWQLLCQSFSKKLAEFKGKESGEALKKITWEYWGAMQFLLQAKNDFKNDAVENFISPHSSESESVAMEDSHLTKNSSEAENVLGCEDTPLIPIVSMRVTKLDKNRRKRFRQQTRADIKKKKLSVTVMSDVQKPKDSSESVVSRFKRSDKFHEFGEYVASTLRQMPRDFVEKAMAELQLALSQLNKEAATLRLQRVRQLQSKDPLCSRCCGESESSGS